MHPHLFRIGPVTVPTFGAVAALGLVLAITLAARCARRVQVSEDAVWNLCLFSVAGTLLLSRAVIAAQVWRAFLHYPLYILTLPTVTKFGLAISLACAAAYALYKRLPLLRTADALTPGVLLLQASLHLGTLFSGDDLGLPTAWRVGRVFGTEGYHPVALYAAVLSLAACGATYVFLTHEAQAGETLGLGMALFAVMRFAVDMLRPAFLLPETVVGHLLRVDQLLLTALAAAGLCFFFQRSRDERNAQ